MPCPHCQAVGSRLSNACTNCGTPLRPTEPTQLPLPFAPLPPGFPVAPELPATKDMGPASSRTPVAQRGPISFKVPTRRAPFQWNIPLFLVAMGIAAVAGRGLRLMFSPDSRGTVRVSPNNQTGAVPSLELSAPPVEISSSSDESTRQAQASEDAAIASHSFSETAPPIFADINMGKLQRADANYVPFPYYVPSSHKLRLRNSRPLLDPAQTQLTECYQRWKWRQGEGASQVERLMDLYSPDAQILWSPGTDISRDQLRQIIIQMRLAGFFSSVSDQKPPQWVQNANGSEAEVLAFQLYMDDGHNRLWGQRHMVWQKQDDQWLIIRDEFPPCYFTNKRRSVRLPHPTDNLVQEQSTVK